MGVGKRKELAVSDFSFRAFRVFVISVVAHLFSFKTYRRPLRVPLRTAHGAWTEREGIIVRLEDEGGHARYGEIAPLPWSGTETLAEAGEQCRALGGRVPSDVLASVPVKCGCVRFGLAQALASPGARRDGNSRLAVAALLPSGPEAVPALRTKLEAGFLAFKWKVGVAAVDDELGLLDDLLEQLPAHGRLRLDANGGWNRREAGRWLARCAERPVEFVEQPVAATDEDTLLGLARDYPVKLALDESVTGLAAARHWQELGWPGVLVIKPALTGPLAELVDWIHATKADVVISSAIETALGRSAILEAALGQPLTSRPLGFGMDGIFGDPLWDGPVIGPVADSSSLGVNPGEKLWAAL